MCGSFVIALALSTGHTQAYTMDEVVQDFFGLLECDGSKKAEEACKKHCTGDGVLTEGQCRQQPIWKLCRNVCRQDWVKDCAQTASKHNLEGLTKCQ